ncbi:MAG: hypothetical protein Q9182_003826 [Xanthomendoza sp. 2 TL-2023]
MDAIGSLQRAKTRARKYRDEPRPRQGLLRTREFLMKDLYTFDASPQEAEQTYNNVRLTYNSLFDKLRIPYLVAKADSGSMGGEVSHEYHFPTPNGEDTIISCGSCTYTINEELASRNLGPTTFKRSTDDSAPYGSWFGVSKDRLQLVEAIVPRATSASEHQSPLQTPAKVNPYLMRALYPDLDLSIEEPLRTFVNHWIKPRSSTASPTAERPPSLVCIYDYRVPQSFIDTHSLSDKTSPLIQKLSKIVRHNRSISPECIDLARFRDGDQCPNCGKHSVKIQQAVELGHTFYLGDRYSNPLGATFAAPGNADGPEAPSTSAPATKDPATKGRALAQGRRPFQMGCHGIGISRMIAAVADSLADQQGLLWPRVMAPYEAVILSTPEHTAAAEEVWDLLSLPREDSVEAVLDDRDRGLVWKMKDADLIGFPIVIILGTQYRDEKLCEVAIRRLGIRQKVSVEELRGYILERLDQI